MSNEPDQIGPPKIPCLFATIHFKSEQRPDGYTAEDIAKMNQDANGDKP